MDRSLRLAAFVIVLVLVATEMVPTLIAAEVKIETNDKSAMGKIQPTDISDKGKIETVDNSVKGKIETMDNSGKGNIQGKDISAKEKTQTFHSSGKGEIELEGNDDLWKDDKTGGIDILRNPRCWTMSSTFSGACIVPSSCNDCCRREGQAGGGCSYRSFWPKCYCKRRNCY